MVNNFSKIAIIMSGGGMACSFSAGVILALIEKFNLTNPPIVIGGSGSSGILSYYVSKQYELIKKIWINLLPDKKFLNPYRFWKIIDIDYLVDVILKTTYPLNIEKIKNSSTLQLIATTNYQTGNLNYFSNKQKNIDFFQALKASKAIPIAYNRSVNINGINYGDSWLSARAESSIPKALVEGANKIIIIKTNTKEEFFDRVIYKSWAFLKGKKFINNNLKNLEKISNFTIPKTIKSLVIQPKKRLSVGLLTNNPIAIEEAFMTGYKETKENLSIKFFLQE